MYLSTQVNFNGRCREAFKLYEALLGAKIQTMMTWGESPMADQVPKELHDKIIHASLKVQDSEFMGSDTPPDQYQKPIGFAVGIQFTDKSEAERVFKGLSEGGAVTMPLQETFWAAAFGMLTDKFGVPWMINCGQPS